MDKDWIGQFDSDNAVSGILDTNEYTARFGLALNKEDAQKIVASRKTVLRQQGRVEFGVATYERRYN